MSRQPGIQWSDPVVGKYVGQQWDRPSIEEYKMGLEQQGRLTNAVVDAVNKAISIRDLYDIKFYVAGALTEATDEDKRRYEMVAKLIDQRSQRATKEAPTMFGYVPHLHGTDPVKHPDITPEEVRDIDKLFAIFVPDMHINFLDPLAHGNAIEEGWAEDAMIPTVYLTSGRRLSRLVRGMNNVARTVEYQQFADDGIQRLGGFLDELADWKQQNPDKDTRLFHWQQETVD